MDIETARMLVLGITALGFILWLVALRFLLVSRRIGRAASDDDDERNEGWVSGAVVVEGEADMLSSRAARILAQGIGTNFGAVMVLDKAEDRIRFQRADAGISNLPAAQWFRRGELRFTPVRAGETRVSWLVEPVRTTWLLWSGGIFQALGLIVLLAGSWAPYTFLASSPHPAARWQSFQMLQAVHFLWPPFLFGGLYRAGGRALRSQFQTLAQKLPFCEG